MRGVFSVLLSSWLLVSGAVEVVEVVQLTDQHLDHLYVVGSDPQVHRCEDNQTSGDAGMFGAFPCQSPWPMVDDGMDEVQRLVPRPGWVLMTGDFRRGWSDHTQWEVISPIRNITERLAALFPSSTLVFALGNHDIEPNDAMSEKATWLYSAIADIWSPWLTPDARTQIAKCGFYTLPFTRDARFVVINSCLYDGSDELTANEEDPCGQFAWMRETLNSTRTAGEKAWIIGHCPPGGGYHPQHNTQYVSISREYADVIWGHLFGHIHNEGFQLLLDEQEKDAVGMTLIAPSHTPHPGDKNPSFRMYRFDNGTGEMLSYKNYYADLVACNKAKKLTFVDDYDTATCPDYALPSISPQALSDFRHRLEKNDSLWKIFVERRFAHAGLDTCDDSCRKGLLCQMHYTDQKALADCDK